jgi:hypothetical protein
MYDTDIKILLAFLAISAILCYVRILKKSLERDKLKYKKELEEFYSDLDFHMYTSISGKCRKCGIKINTKTSENLVAFTFSSDSLFKDESRTQLWYEIRRCDKCGAMNILK